MKQTNKKEDFLGKLLGALGASMLGDLLTGRDYWELVVKIKNEKEN